MSASTSAGISLGVVLTLSQSVTVLLGSPVFLLTEGSVVV